MSDQILLDVLLLLIIALFAVIGFWRGAAREGLVTAGIFAGGAIADAWARPWGGDLADMVDVWLGVAQLLVAGTALLLSTLILGYGSGAVLDLPEPPLPSRVVGVLLAGFNGALVLRFGLRAIERHFPAESADQVLDDSRVSWFLLRQSGWLLVGAAVFFGALILISFLIRSRSTAVYPHPSGQLATMPDGSDQGPLPRPVRLPRQSDEGKVEPVGREFSSTTGRYAADAPNVRETIPIGPVDSGIAMNGGRVVPFQRGWDAARRDSRGQVGRGEWLEHGPWPTRPQSQGIARKKVTEQKAEPPATWGSPAAESESRAAPGNENPTGAPRQCRICNAELSATDRFCPICGASAT